ncbi:MAG: hypothetical protein J5689_00585 [Clostridia bacterium]|nr:hypothetical protein [Clostridia bacterium]
MWLDKASERFGKYLLLSDFFDQYAFNKVNIVDCKKIDGQDTYIVDANYYIEDKVCRFYINDFSVMTDVMENPSYVIKNNNNHIDSSLGLYICCYLNKQDRKEYSRQFKDYHNKLLEEEREVIKEF